MCGWFVRSLFRCLLGMSLNVVWKICWRCRCLRMWSSSCSSWIVGSRSSWSGSWFQSYGWRGLYLFEVFVVGYQFQGFFCQVFLDQVFLQLFVGFLGFFVQRLCFFEKQSYVQVLVRIGGIFQFCVVLLLVRMKVVQSSIVRQVL